MKPSILVSVAAYRFKWLLVGLFCALFDTEHHFAHHDELA